MDRNLPCRPMPGLLEVRMRTFYQRDNIGKAKYTVSYHDGESTHKDGSPFYGIAIFKNKPTLAAFIKDLKKQGYIPL